MKEKEGGTHKTLSKKIGKWNMVQCKKFWKQHWQNVLVNIKEYLTGEDEQKKVYFILIVLPVMRERSIINYVSEKNSLNVKCYALEDCCDFSILKTFP